MGDGMLILYLNRFRIERVQRKDSMYVVPCYIAYLIISLAVTIGVAQTLYKNGRIFLVDAFRGNAELADSVNRLLLVGFYLINVGYVTLALSTSAPLDTERQSIELVSTKIGVVLVVLGVLHFFNLYIFSRLRRRAESTPPPVPAR
jgi:hypothetical protein